MNNIFFTGHSLGGYLASYVESEVVDKDISVGVSNKSYTFNAPGVSPAIFLRANWMFVNANIKLTVSAKILFTLSPNRIELPVN
ncbi:lipase (class 3) [Paenisporosarcina sp. OV554]|nr:lipase (class 3) [Paenisporosarcina sp. OV554]